MKVIFNFETKTYRFLLDYEARIEGSLQDMICATPPNLKGHPVTDIEEDHMHCWVIGTSLINIEINLYYFNFRGFYMGRGRHRLAHCITGRDQETKSSSKYILVLFWLS